MSDVANLATELNNATLNKVDDVKENSAVANENGKALFDDSGEVKDGADQLASMLAKNDSQLSKLESQAEDLKKDGDDEAQEDDASGDDAAAAADGPSPRSLSARPGYIPLRNITSIAVGDPLKHSSGELFGRAYTDYEVIASSPETSLTVRRRYKEFEWLHGVLKTFFPEARLEALPQKKFFGRFDANFVTKRQEGLQSFLNSVIANREIANSEFFLHVFLNPNLVTIPTTTSKATGASATGVSDVDTYGPVGGNGSAPVSPPHGNSTAHSYKQYLHHDDDEGTDAAATNGTAATETYDAAY